MLCLQATICLVSSTGVKHPKVLRAAFSTCTTKKGETDILVDLVTIMLMEQVRTKCRCSHSRGRSTQGETRTITHRPRIWEGRNHRPYAGLMRSLSVLSPFESDRCQVRIPRAVRDYL